MAKKNVNYYSLGLFVVAGISFLVLLLYVIGKNQNLFGNTFVLKARFKNVHGLVPGNNVRFSGIDAGTVKNVDVLNDTTMEVTLLVKSRMKPFIRKDALITIGTDGFLGNHVVNIQSVGTVAPQVKEGDTLDGAKGFHTEEMLQVLSGTNNEVAAIALELRQTIRRVNESKVIWRILDDERLPEAVHGSLTRLKSASDHLNNTMRTLSRIVDDVKNGKGTVGKLLRDTAIAVNIYEAIDRIKGITNVADTLSEKIGNVVASVTEDLESGKGTAHILLKDEVMAAQLASTIQILEQDARSVSEVLNAIKQSFLFRGYFRKLERKKKEQEKMGVIK